MKKIFSILLTAVILTMTLCTFVPSISAAEDDWVLAPYAEYITHDGKIYYDLRTSYSLEYDAYHRVKNLKFTDEKTKEKYDGSEVYVYPDAEDIVVQVDLYVDYSYTETRVYVEESHLQEYEYIKQGIANEYSIWNYYDYNEFKFTDIDYNEWLSGSTVTMDASKVYNYNWYNIYACDDASLFSPECAMILHDYYSDELYLLSYSDYDSSYFYSDGSFNTDIDKKVTVYRLKDESLKNKIVTFINTEPEDDLDWLVTNEVSDTVAIVFCSIFFGIIPLATFLFALVMFFVVKDKKYRRPYAVIALGSLLVLVSCGVILLMLI